MEFEALFQAIDDGEGLAIATDALMALTLISVRMQAFLYLSPFFNRYAMPRTVRVGFILAMSIILFPPTFEAIQAQPDFQQIFLALIAKEFLIGMILGVCMWMPIRGLELTGTVLDTQRGSMQAMGLDVVFGGQTTPTAIFLLQVFSGYFFTVGGLLIIQDTLFQSANIWPITSTLPPFSEDTIISLGGLTGTLFFSAIALALPISILMVLADVIIAFIAKTAPTLNALVFGMPVKSALLCIMLFFYIDIAYPKIMTDLHGALEQIRDLLK